VLDEDHTFRISESKVLWQIFGPKRPSGLFNDAVSVHS
jgi:hypothetical protein